MKQLTILSGRCLVVEMPEGAKLRGLQKLQPNGLIYADPCGHDVLLDLPPGNWRIIGMLSEVTEEQAEQIVGFGDADPSGDRFVVGHRLFDKEQEEPFLFWRDVTALESLDSAILAENWYFENPYGKDEPIVDDPDPHSQYHGAQQDELARWQQAQSRVLDRSRCLLLGRDA